MHDTIPSWLPTLILVPLVGFALYRRYKQTFGRQRLSRARMIVRIVLFTLLGAVVLVTAKSAIGALAAIGGFAFGLAVGAYGLAKTQFETTPTGTFFVPHTKIGIAISALFIGRLAARFFTVYESVGAAQAAGQGPPIDANRSVLTAAIFLLMAGYYIAYSGGLLWKARALMVSAPARLPEEVEGDARSTAQAETPPRLP